MPGTFTKPGDGSVKIRPGSRVLVKSIVTGKSHFGVVLLIDLDHHGEYFTVLLDDGDVIKHHRSLVFDVFDLKEYPTRSESMDKNQLNIARATLIAASSVVAEKYATLQTIEEYQAAWREELMSSGEIEGYQADALIEHALEAFVSALSKGETFGEWRNKVDARLMELGLTTQEEIDQLSTTRARSKKAASTSSAATAVPATLPDGVEIGDKVTIDGQSWKGFVATIVGFDGTWIHVTTPMPSGKLYEGKTRPAKILSVVEKATPPAELEDEPIGADGTFESDAPAAKTEEVIVKKIFPDGTTDSKKVELAVKDDKAFYSGEWYDVQHLRAGKLQITLKIGVPEI